MRRQWTAQVKSLLDFNQWKQEIKEAQTSLDEVQMEKKFYKIDGEKAGIIRENLKYGFPCDNSIIRVDKL